MKKMDLKGVDAALDANARAAEELAKREEQARARLAAIDGDYGDIRGERTAALARGEDPAALTERLRGLREERELLEDEIPTFGTRKAGLEAARKELLGQREALRLQALRGKLRRTVAAYNEAARALGEAVREIRALQTEAADPEVGGALGSPIPNWHNALAEIWLPVLFAAEDGGELALPRFDNDTPGLWHLRAQRTAVPNAAGLAHFTLKHLAGGKA